MYHIIDYKTAYKDNWNEFARKHGSVFHLIEWREILMHSFGYKTNYTMLIDDDAQIRAILPMVSSRDLTFKKAAVSLPFINYLDVCADSEEAGNYLLDNLHSYLNSHRLEYIELRLKDSTLKDDLVSLNENNYTFYVPLEGDEEQILSKSSGNNRNHVRKTYKNNWFSSSLSLDNFDEFYKIFLKTNKRLGSPAPGEEFFLNIMHDLRDYVRLLTVIDNETNKVIGGMFLFADNEMLYYPWGGCLPEYNKKYVNNFMYWEAVKYGLNNGFKYLDLGRSPFESGTYKFKQQWGAEAHKLKYYRFSKNNKKVEKIESDDVGFLVNTWKKLPDIVTDHLGKKIIKYVMP